MRTKAGDEPRSGSRKILDSHASSDAEPGGFLTVSIDQVVLARQPGRIFFSSALDGLAKVQPEVCVAYPPYCLARSKDDLAPDATTSVPDEALHLGFLVAQAGAGFAAPIHLERFASPGRLILTDEPRLSSLGGVGCLVLPASLSQLAEALKTGKATVRATRSVQVHLSGRFRPFVGARDLALDLRRRGLIDIIRAVDATTHAPVIVEFTGPSVKFLSVPERAVVAAVAPRLGAAGAFFPSDEKTEAYLRDQKRSKAFRSLSADAGTTYDEVVSIDLSAIEPLLLDENEQVRPVREFDGKPIRRVLLGGDSGITLKDLFTVAALLKSKRVAPHLEFLFAPPSRQSLEALAQSSALADLFMAGMRVVEPDRRVLTLELYPSSADAPVLYNCEPELHPDGTAGIVASAETLSLAACQGEISDPRAFKRPVRVSLPRTLPTEDVLIRRGPDVRGAARGKGRVDKKTLELPPQSSTRFSDAGRSGDWLDNTELKVVASLRRSIESASGQSLALMTSDLGEILWLAEHLSEVPCLRAVIAPHIPASVVARLSDVGVLALRATPETYAELSSTESLLVPSPTAWASHIDLGSQGPDRQRVFRVDWLAAGPERAFPRSNGSS